MKRVINLMKMVALSGVVVLGSCRAVKDGTGVERAEYGREMSRLGFGRKEIPIRAPNRSCITSITGTSTWCRFPCGM